MDSREEPQTMDRHFDIVVIGAGVIGAAVAFRQSKAGKKVLLIDKGSPGSGASFGNAGMIANSEIAPFASLRTLKAVPRMMMQQDGPLQIDPFYFPKMVPWVLKFLASTRRSKFNGAVEILSKLCGSANADTKDLLGLARADHLIVPKDFIRLYKSRKHFLDVRADWEFRRKNGVNYKELDRTDLKKFLPELGPAQNYGVMVKDYHMVSDPQQAVCALVAAFEANGGVLVQTEVMDLNATSAQIELTTAQNETFSGDKIVIAAGAYSHLLAAKLGEHFPLETERGYHVQFPDPGVIIDRTLACTENALAISPMQKGLRFSSFVEFAGLTKPANPKRFDQIIQKSKNVFPQLNTENPSFWMGHRPSLPDGLPAVGPSARHTNVYYCFGHGHLGLTLAAGTSAVLSDMLNGISPAPSMSALLPKRFSSTHSAF